MTFTDIVNCRNKIEAELKQALGAWVISHQSPEEMTFNALRDLQQVIQLVVNKNLTELGQVLNSDKTVR